MRLETERLLLRPWKESDKKLYAAVIRDPEVRRFFPAVGTYADADAGIERAKQRLKDFGFSFLAVERKQDGAFMGMLGMAAFRDELRDVIPTRPKVEIGWQLGKQFWGHGYAPEGARAFLDYAWTPLGLPEVVAITYEGNWPSRRVMEKIGMSYDPRCDFQHPDVPSGHKVRPHVLYRILNPTLAV